MSAYLHEVLLPILKKISCLISHATLWAWFNITKLLEKRGNQATCFIIIIPIVFCNVVSIKCIILLNFLLKGMIVWLGSTFGAKILFFMEINFINIETAYFNIIILLYIEGIYIHTMFN